MLSMTYRHNEDSSSDELAAEVVSTTMSITSPSPLVVKHVTHKKSICEQPNCKRVETWVDIECDVCQEITQLCFYCAIYWSYYDGQCSHCNGGTTVKSAAAPSVAKK